MLLVAIPLVLSGDPWLLLDPNSQNFLLYNHEVQYSASTQTVTFFNPSSIHTYFPLSYIFARVFYVIVPSPLLVEFISPAIISSVLLGVLCVSWIKESPRQLGFLAIFAVGSLILFYVISDQWLWFRSIGSLELIVFITLFASPGRKPFTSQPTAMVFLIAAMVLGDDGVVSFAAILFLLAQYGMSARRDREYVAWAGLLAVCVVVYAFAIRFAGESYYGRYLPVLQYEVNNLLNLNLRFSGHLAAVGLPEFQSLGLAIAFLTMFGILPLLLLWHGLTVGIRRRNFVVPGFLIALGVALRISNTVTATAQYVGALYGFVLFVFVPVSVFALVRASGRGSSRPQKGGYAKSLKILTVVVFGCVLVLSTFQLNPILPHGAVASVSDNRMRFVYLRASGLFTNEHGTSPVTVMQISDISTLFVNPPAPSSDYLLTSGLPSPFAQRPSLGSSDLLYNNGPFLLVAKR